MKKLNVLVTAVGGPTALGVLKCLKDIANIRLVGTDIYPYTAGHLLCQTVRRVSPVSEAEKYKTDIVEIIKEENIDVVFPTLQDEIPIYLGLREKITANVALPTSEHYEALLDKEKLYCFLSERDLNKYIPKYFGFQDNTELKQIVSHAFFGERYICVKKAQGHGGIGFIVLTNRENYLQALKTGKTKICNIDDYYDIESSDRRIVMEYLDGTEYSVDVLIHNGKVLAVIPRKRNRVSNGVVIDGTVEFNQEIMDAASEIATQLIGSGFINLQFINSHNGYKLTDVNARFCGSQIMSYGAGVNLPYLYIQCNILKETVHVSPRWNTRMIRYWESCFFYD